MSDIITDERFETVSITMSPKDAELLRRVAKDRHLPVSELVRQGLALLYQKFIDETEAGIYTDLNGNVVYVGLLSNSAKVRLATGEIIKVKSF